MRRPLPLPRRSSWERGLRLLHVFRQLQERDGEQRCKNSLRLHGLLLPSQQTHARTPSPWVQSSTNLTEAHRRLQRSLLHLYLGHGMEAFFNPKNFIYPCPTCIWNALESVKTGEITTHLSRGPNPL